MALQWPERFIAKSDFAIMSNLDCQQERDGKVSSRSPVDAISGRELCDENDVLTNPRSYHCLRASSTNEPSMQEHVQQDQKYPELAFVRAIKT
jgi:hypothetical protein